MNELEAGQRALSAGRFDDARRAFEAALAEEESAEAHEGLGWAAVWRDDVVAGIGSFESAHRLYLEQGDNRGAGRVALWLVYCHGYILGQSAIAGGWAERALRLLEGLEPGPEHVWLAISTAAATRAVDTVETRRLVRQAAEIGRELARPDLEAMGLASEGLVLVAEGEVAGGMRLLDEAAAAAIASDSDDFAAVGHTCCAMLAACELSGDVERASEWSERTTAYAGRYGFRPLYATCRTSYAGVLIWCGRWAEAEEELLRAESEFAAVRAAARGQPIVRLAELRRRQGRFAEAAELFARVEGSRGALLALAALALDNGDARGARDLAERSLRQTPLTSRAERSVALELLVGADIGLGEVEAGERALEELKSIAAVAPTEPLQARASRAGGKVAAARGALERRAGCSRMPSISSAAATRPTRPHGRDSTLLGSWAKAAGRRQPGKRPRRRARRLSGSPPGTVSSRRPGSLPTSRMEQLPLARRWAISPLASSRCSGYSQPASPTASSQRGS